MTTNMATHAGPIWGNFRRRITIMLLAILVLAMVPFGLLTSIRPAKADIGPGSLLTSDRVHGLVENYYLGVRSLSAQQWGANLDANVFMEDPIGAPAALGRDQAMQRYGSAPLLFSDISMFPQEIQAPTLTNEAAVRWTTTVTLRATGQKSQPFGGITLFAFNNKGLVTSLRVFWDPTDIKF